MLNINIKTFYQNLIKSTLIYWIKQQLLAHFILYLSVMKSSERLKSKRA
jgi:hypothetical protein